LIKINICKSIKQATYVSDKLLYYASINEMSIAKITTDTRS